MKRTPTKTTVWFNRGVSSTYNVIETIKAACRPEDNFRLICTHSYPGFTARGISDEFYLEPTDLSAGDYTEWALNFAREHDVDVLFPTKHLNVLSAAEARFEHGGTKLIVPGPLATIQLLDNKASLYDHLGPKVVPLPEYRRVNTLAQFDAAYAELSERFRRVCFKPAVGINGNGFRAITATTNALDRLYDGDRTWIGLDEARFAFGLAERFDDLLVMPYLPGIERSIDCLAHKGKLVRGIVRVKMHDGFDELLEDNPLLLQYADRLTTRLKLRGLFNIQFMDAEAGEPYLLEINARQAGGAHFSALSGVTLPYWAVRLVTGSASRYQVPLPRTGIRVGRASKAVLIEN